MKEIKNQEFGGERPLYCEKDLNLENVVIHAGESALKETANITATRCRFEGKYPFWCCDHFIVRDCIFTVGARAALWYSRDLLMEDTVIDAPKMFREMHHVHLEDVVINDADETFWRCQFVEAVNLELHNGTYPFMFCNHVRINGLKCDSLYAFQYCKNVELHNANIVTKDSFWECENVNIYDSVINGEYLAWHSKNVRLVNCHLVGEQLLCYAKNLVLENCTFDAACDRVFEYSSVNADIRGHIENIKNPKSGHIVADSIGSITIDEFVKEPNDCIIETRS